MQRPVWLFSMDTEQFGAPPLTTGALKAHFVHAGRSADRTTIELVHFLQERELRHWLDVTWPETILPQARACAADGMQPVFALSCYTWNVAQFIDIARTVKRALPESLIVGGGPHVQRARDFLYEDGFDVIVLGEGEMTFTELLDCTSREQWSGVAGLAYLLSDGARHQTPTRERQDALDRFPSALDVVPLRDDRGRPLYLRAAYESSRGCPYRCAFCEWGTGAIGTRMYQFSLERIRADLEKLVAGGVEDIWFCDSNFGALREDRDKAEIVVDLRRRTGYPRTFATSWSKNHNRRVQDIVRLLHRNGLLWHYHLALQTLTPRALELSHRTNMRANDYEPVVRALAAEGVPVAAELIWGLPGDSFDSFEANLDRIMRVFPNFNIFGYTLLPGTEFFDRREEYAIEALPVAGYGKAKGEYVVGCSSFSRDEGEEGYFLIAASVILVRGQIMPLTARLLALDGRLRVGHLLRAVLRDLANVFAGDLDRVPCDRMATYEQRAPLYLRLIADLDRAYRIIADTLRKRVSDAAPDLLERVLKVLDLDQAQCPRGGATRRERRTFLFRVDRVLAALGGMQLPESEDFESCIPVSLELNHPGGVGEVLLDPDGGEWMRARVVGVSIAGLPALAGAAAMRGLEDAGGNGASREGRAISAALRS
jgi:hypothetical protein